MPRQVSFERLVETRAPEHNDPLPMRGNGRLSPSSSCSGAPEIRSSATIDYSTRNSTRRFCARPSGVALEATGFDSPRPTAVIRLAAIPCLTR